MRPMLEIYEASPSTIEKNLNQTFNLSRNSPHLLKSSEEIILENDEP